MPKAFDAVVRLQNAIDEVIRLEDWWTINTRFRYDVQQDQMMSRLVYRPNQRRVG
jgi:hypothetical protein